MKAMIMAGGEGSRLRPLTCDCPKPMVPLLDKPVMAYALELLARHGVREAGVTLAYLPDRLRDYFADGASFGVNLKYFTELVPLGTAGSVRQGMEFLDETFAVLSGDGVTDCDLGAALQFHRERGAQATLVLKHVEAPLEYGVVIADREGRVRRFVEKPGWGEVFSDTVNTGIYILEPEVLRLIPEGKPYDFGRELFPQMLAQGMAVYGYVMEGYWCDVGDISAYLKAHIDALDGRINLNFPNRPGGVYRMPGAQIDRGAILEGPCFLGEGAQVRSGARIGAYSVIGAGCVVEEHASVKRSVLWPGARLMARAQARGAILQRGAELGEEASAFEESVLGDGAVLGSRATLMSGVKVWPQKRVADGVRLDTNLVWGGVERPCFRRGAISLCTPAAAIRAAQAYASAVKPSGVLAGRSASTVALSLYMAMLSGLLAQGVQVYDGGVMTIAQARCALRQMGIGGMLYVDENGMHPMDGRGIDLDCALQRKIEAKLLRQDYERAFAGVTKLPVQTGRTDLFYLGALSASVESELHQKKPKVAIFAPTEQLLSLSERAMERAGCVVRAEWEEELMELEADEIGIWLLEAGEKVRFTARDAELTDAENELLLVWVALEMGVKELTLPVSSTHGAERLAGKYGVTVARVKSERAHLMQTMYQNDPRQMQLMFDGIYAALQVLAQLSRRTLSLSQWLKEMPRLFRATRTVPVDWAEKGRVLGALSGEEARADLTDGLCVEKGNGWTWVSPSAERAECCVMSEALDMETAQELCDGYVERIRRLLKREASS